MKREFFIRNEKNTIWLEIDICVKHSDLWEENL